MPEPSGYAPIEFGGEDEENLYFILEKNKNGAGQDVYYVKGLNELGMTQLSLKIPAMVDGIPVVFIDEFALSGSEARTLVLGDNISELASGAFDGAKELIGVYIPKADPNEIATPNCMNEDGLAIRGARDDLKIYVPEEALGEYHQDYFWGDYANRLIGYEKNN